MSKNTFQLHTARPGRGDHGIQRRTRGPRRARHRWRHRHRQAPAPRSSPPTARPSPSAGAPRPSSRPPADAASTPGDGGSVRYVVADVTNEDDVAHGRRGRSSQRRRSTACVANAGGGGGMGPYHLQQAAEFTRVLHLNVLGTLFSLKHSVPHLVAAAGRRRCSFIGMSSIAGHVTHPYFGAYCRVEGRHRGDDAQRRRRVRPHARALQRDPARASSAPRSWRASRATARCTHSYIENTPMDDVGEPEDIADLARFLVGAESRWITGQIINVDGGHSLRRGPDFGVVHPPGHRRGRRARPQTHRRLTWPSARTAARSSPVARAASVGRARWRSPHQGCDIALADINEERLAATKAEIEALGRAVHRGTRSTSASDRRHRRRSPTPRSTRSVRCTSRCSTRASRCSVRPISCRSTSWQLQMDVNFFGIVRCVNAFVPRMRPAGHGHVINTASIAGRYAYSYDAGPYIASKFAAYGYSENLALYLRPQGVNVSVLCPGLVLTNLGENASVPACGSDCAWGHFPEWMLRPITAGRRWPMVVDAVRQNRFLIYTHPEDEVLIANAAPTSRPRWPGSSRSLPTRHPGADLARLHAIMFEDTSQCSSSPGRPTARLRRHRARPITSRSPRAQSSTRRVRTFDGPHRLFPDPFTSIAAMAAVTSGCGSCPTSTSCPMREPFSVAKQAATVAALSNYRLALGAGVGWLREEDRAARARPRDAWPPHRRDDRDPSPVLARRNRRVPRRVLRLRADGHVPAPGGPIPIWIGGKSAAALREPPATMDGSA